MGWRTVISKVIGRYEEGANYKLGQSLSSSAVSTIFGTGGDPINVLEEYNGFAWKAINIRATMLSAEDLYVERLIGKEWQQDQSHEFNTVLEGEEGQSDLSELLYAHSVCMDMYGESFWYFSKGETSSKPFGVYLLDPSAMTVMVAGNRVTGYVYQKDGVRAVLELDEVLHRYLPNVKHQFRGYGAMQAAGWFIKSNRYLYTYMNNFMDNNAIPAGVVVAKDAVDDNDWKLFKHQWSEKYGGVANAGKTAFLRGKDVDFIQTGMSLGDVDFDKLKNSSRDDVMVMFGISKPMMAIFDDINRASAVTAKQLFAMTFTEPELMALKRKLTKKVVRWYGEQFRIGSTNPVPEDEEAKLAMYDKLVGRAITINEVRAAYGLLPLPEGDQLAPGTPAVAPKSLGKIRIKIPATTTDVKKNDKAQFSYEMKESYRSEMESLQNKYEQSFLKAINPVLKDQRDRMIAQIQPKKVIDAKFDVAEETKNLEQVLLPIFLELAREQGAMSIAFAGNDSMKFELTAPMEKYIRDSIARSCESFTKHTQELVAKAVMDAINDGESINSISNHIKDIYKDVLGVKNPGYRSERLARTEVIKASNEVSEVAYKQSGVVSKKEWFRNPGACEFCQALNGSIIQLDATFIQRDGRIEGVDGGTRVNTYEDVKHPPIHSNCRCTIIPVIEG